MLDLELLGFGPQGWGAQLLRGAGMTLAVATLSFSFGLIAGTALATAKLTGGWIARGLAEAYTTVLRGVPELLVIYLFFFGSTGAVMAVARLFGHTGYLELDRFTLGVLAVGSISAAYSTEVVRGAVQAIPRGQIEAGKALGMSRRLIARRVLLPQTLRLALPGLGNVWQATLKDTALISVTALVELMRASHVAAGSTRQPFVFYIAGAVLYLVLTSGSQTVFRWAERFYGRGAERPG